MTVPQEKAPANYVPAAAVIRRGQALSGFTGCKGSAGSFAGSSIRGNPGGVHGRLRLPVDGRWRPDGGKRNYRCSGEMRRDR